MALLFFFFIHIPKSLILRFLSLQLVLVAIVAPIRVGGARLSNFHDGRSGRWHGLITVWPSNLEPDSFRQHSEIHWFQIKDQIKAAIFFAES